MYIVYKYNMQDKDNHDSSTTTWKACCDLDFIFVNFRSSTPNSLLAMLLFCLLVKVK